MCVTSHFKNHSKFTSFPESWPDDIKVWVNFLIRTKSQRGGSNNTPPWKLDTDISDTLPPEKNPQQIKDNIPLDLIPFIFNLEEIFNLYGGSYIYISLILLWYPSNFLYNQKPEMEIPKSPMELPCLVLIIIFNGQTTTWSQNEGHHHQVQIYLS